MGKEYIKKEEEKPTKLFTLDTETRGLDGNIFRVGLFDGTNYYPSNDFNKIKQILLGESIENDVHIFIHNLNFDLSKVIGDLRKEILWLESIIINGRATIIKTGDFTFHDSYSLFPYSLDKLCKDFDVKNRKMDLIEALEGTDYIVYYDEIKTSVYDEETDTLTTIIEKPENKINKKETLKKYFMNVDPLDPLLNEYLEFDCRSLYEIVATTVKISGLAKKDFVLAPTTASLSLQAYKSKFKDDYKKAISTNYMGRDNAVEEKLREAYYGGRTEVFIPKLKTGFHYDVNSLYPFCMREYKYPIGDYKIIDNPLKAKIQYLVFKKMKDGKHPGGGTVEATVIIPNDMEYPILPYRAFNKGKLLFPVGEIRGSWTLHELEFAEQRGVKIKEIHSMIYFGVMESLFEKFVTYFEKLKNDNTFDSKNPDKKINPSLRQYAKLILNSLYGKFATGREKTAYTSSREIVKTIEKFEKKGEIFEPEIIFFKDVLRDGIEVAQQNWYTKQDMSILGRMPTRYKNYFLDEELIQFNSYLTSEYVQVQISAYVTAYARMELYKGIEQIISRGGKVYYGDTDSLVSDIEMEPNMISDYEFGKWKLEGEIIKAYFNQPKVYIEETIEKGKSKINKKFKGIPKDRVDQMNMSDYAYINKRQEKQDIDFIPIIEKKDGYVNQIKPITALKSNKPFNTLIQIEKGLNLRGLTEKRKMDYENNTSQPWSFDPGTPNEMETYFEKLREENIKELKASANKFTNTLLNEGFIQIPKKGTELYKQYLEIPKHIRQKYFRTKGLALDIWCEFVYYNPEDLLLEFSLML